MTIAVKFIIVFFPEKETTFFLRWLEGSSRDLIYGFSEDLGVDSASKNREGWSDEDIQR